MKEYFMKGIFESTPNESEISIRRYNTEGEDVKLPIIKKYESIEK